MGYSSVDGIRKKFTGYERDSETGLDYAQARYFSSAQGRFTSPDPLLASAKSIDPQSWNRYSYVGNNPMVFADPSGLSRGPAGLYSSIHDADKAPQSRGNNTLLEEAEAAWEVRLTDTLEAIRECEWLNELARTDPGGAASIAASNPMIEAQLQNPVPQPAPDPGQPLSPCVKNRLSPYFSGVNLDHIRVQEGIPDYVVGDPLAYTEGNRIYFKKGRYDPHSVQGLSDIGHEVTHSEQYAKLGTINFQAQYLGQYLELRRLGFAHETAYQNISFEIEARKRADIINRDLTNLMRDFGGRDPCPK
jgi:RHS repeat-associated protein